ncbi:MAG: hypothetical protein EBY18_24510, partial [Alphaproteobacteria bacterium]|nr:hypothetical protein [Alphaproteobacteria bacterium]
MTDRPLITDEELHAYIDGELDPLRAADVAVLIQYRPELQARVAAFRADKALLTQAYGPLVDQPIPAHWQAMIDARRSGGRPVLARRAMFAAAASAAVAFAGWSTYSRLRGDADDTIIAEALSARPKPNNLSARAVAASLSNGMIAPLVPMAIKGVIWYQGESNVTRSKEYRDLLTAMIADWRGQWGQGDFPFCIVQLANYYG